MKPGLARRMTRIYPSLWRERYGDEFEALLEMTEGSFKTIVNIGWAAMGEHLAPTQGGKMSSTSISFVAMLKKPTAFIPLAMSLAGLILVLGHVAMFGPAQEADEGAAAHIWQLLMAGQLPLIAYFAFAWCRRAPRQGLEVMALQVVAALASLAPVFFWNL